MSETEFSWVSSLWSKWQSVISEHFGGLTKPSEARQGPTRSPVSQSSTVERRVTGTGSAQPRMIARDGAVQTKPGPPRRGLILPGPLCRNHEETFSFPPTED